MKQSPHFLLHARLKAVALALQPPLPCAFCLPPPAPWPPFLAFVSALQPPFLLIPQLVSVPPLIARAQPRPLPSVFLQLQAAIFSTPQPPSFVSLLFVPLPIFAFQPPALPPILVFQPLTQLQV